MSHTVSIIIPCFNAAAWIAATLESVAEQYCLQMEVIAVDDGSTDTSADIIARQFPWIRLIRTENKGCSAARTEGARHAVGQWIKFLDADDLLTGDILKRQLLLAEQSDADVIYGNWQRLVVDEKGGWILDEEVERKWQDVHPADIELAFFTDMWCPTAAYLWKADFLRSRHPGWHPDLPVIQDARFAFDAARAGASFLYDDSIGVLYRVHEKASVSTRSKAQFLIDILHSAHEIRELWINEDMFGEERCRAVKSAYRQVVRGLLVLDDPRYRQAYLEAVSFFPGMTFSESRIFNILAKVFGIQHADLIGRIFRKY